jgi:tRNA-specific 2-thiouridylase
VKTKKHKVFVGISGGVDSSIAAYLLQQQGYEVHGIFVKTWSPEWLPCTWLDEKRDAMRVCAHLDIPFHFLDAEDEYKTGVAEYMIEEYKAGRTPNPDVLCNRVIKFGSMWQYAKAHGADYIATGHYAQITDGLLAKGVDASKDQSYFLWMLTAEDLSHTLFPIGHLQKKEVRSIAQTANLFTATKKDSQGICFLGDIDMREFLSHYIEQNPGLVITEDGKTVGQHDGAVFYTIGERHGFTITEKSSHRLPYYIVGKDMKKNILIVSHEPKTKINSSEQRVTLREVQLAEKIDFSKKYVGQIRYHGAYIPLILHSPTEVTLNYDEALPLGQSLVIYDDEKVIGGGIIHSFE